MIKKDKIQFWAANNPVKIAFGVIVVIIIVAVVLGFAILDEPEAIPIQELQR